MTPERLADIRAMLPAFPTTGAGMWKQMAEELVAAIDEHDKELIDDFAGRLQNARHCGSCGGLVIESAIWVCPRCNVIAQQGAPTRKPA